MFHFDRQMTQNGIVELECGFQLFQGFAVAFDVHQNIVGLGELVDHVGQLATTPVFNTMDFSTA